MAKKERNKREKDTKDKKKKQVRAREREREKKTMEGGASGREKNTKSEIKGRRRKGTKEFY